MKTKPGISPTFSVRLALGMLDPQGGIAKTWLLVLWACQARPASDKARRGRTLPKTATGLAWPLGKEQAKRLIGECVRALADCPQAARSLHEDYFSLFGPGKARLQRGTILFILGEFIWQVTYRQSLTVSGETKRLELTFRRRNKGTDESVFAGSEEIKLTVSYYTKVAERPFQIHYARRIRYRITRRCMNTFEALRRAEQFLADFAALASPASRDISRLN